MGGIGGDDQNRFPDLGQLDGQTTTIYREMEYLVGSNDLKKMYFTLPACGFADAAFTPDKHPFQ